MALHTDQDCSALELAGAAKSSGTRDRSYGCGRPSQQGDCCGSQYQFLDRRNSPPSHFCKARCWFTSGHGCPLSGYWKNRGSTCNLCQWPPCALCVGKYARNIKSLSEVVTENFGFASG